MRIGSVHPYRQPGKGVMSPPHSPSKVKKGNKAYLLANVDARSKALFLPTRFKTQTFTILNPALVLPLNRNEEASVFSFSL